MAASNPEDNVSVINKQTAIKINETDLVKEAIRALAAEKALNAGELTITLLDKAEMSGLNRDYRGKKGPTDVLSFSMESSAEGGGFKPPVRVLGDVVICPELISELSAAEGADVDYRLREAVIHGILHLLGYSHGDAEKEKAMLGRQEELLTKKVRSGSEGS